MCLGGECVQDASNDCGGLDHQYCSGLPKPRKARGRLIDATRVIGQSQLDQIRKYLQPGRDKLIRVQLCRHPIAQCETAICLMIAAIAL